MNSLPSFAILLLSLVLANAQGQNISVPLTAGRMKKKLCPAVDACIKQLDKGQECNILPVLSRSVLPAIDPGTYLLTKLRDGVWAYNDGAYYSLILIMGNRLAVIDFPDSGGSNKNDGSGTRLTDAVEELLGDIVPTRVDMIYSHSHYDHIGAGTRFFNYAKKQYKKANFVIWGSQGTKTAIKASSSKRAVEPSEIVGPSGSTLNLGQGLEIRMEPVDGHSDNTDMLLYIPKSGKEKSIVMVVDIVFPRWAPFSNFALSTNLREYLAVHKKILSYNFDIFVGGHLLLGKKNDVKENLKFTEDVIKAAGTALKQVTNEDFVDGGFGKFFDPSAPEFGNIWFAFLDVARKLQIDACYRIVIEKWGCKISGLDSTLRSHCFTAVEFNLLDL